MKMDAGAMLLGAIGGAFDFCLGTLPAGIRTDPRAASLDLLGIESAIKRLLEALRTQKSMGARSMERDLAALEYPLAKLRDYVDGRTGALDRQGTEIMAEYVELRLARIREDAESLDDVRRCA